MIQSVACGVDHAGDVDDVRVVHRKDLVCHDSVVLEARAAAADHEHGPAEAVVWWVVRKNLDHGRIGAHQRREGEPGPMVAHEDARLGHHLHDQGLVLVVLVRVGVHQQGDADPGELGQLLPLCNGRLHGIDELVEVGDAATPSALLEQDGDVHHGVVLQVRDVDRGTGVPLRRLLGGLGSVHARPEVRIRCGRAGARAHNALGGVDQVERIPRRRPRGPKQALVDARVDEPCDVDALALIGRLDEARPVHAERL
mmetsp:Transcript_364/g.1268  ORF Transcript_364/g.1268 Transcript_364/m.1268 type:complete len:255 (+) Transcript_364:330-1094(+)